MIRLLPFEVRRACRQIWQHPVLPVHRLMQALFHDPCRTALRERPWEDTQ